MDFDDKLEKEYENHKIPKEISVYLIDQYAFLLNVDDTVDELEKCEGRYCRLLVRNKIRKNINSIVSSFLDYSTEDIINMDERYILSIIELIHDVTDYSSRIVEYTDSDNYMEMARLFDFMILHYTNSLCAKEAKREGLKYIARGIDYMDNRVDDTSGALRIFMSNKLKKLEEIKQLEKRK